jgi:hypothetical protein
MGSGKSVTNLSRKETTRDASDGDKKRRKTLFIHTWFFLTLILFNFSFI